MMNLSFKRSKHLIWYIFLLPVIVFLVFQIVKIYNCYFKRPPSKEKVIEYFLENRNDFECIAEYFTDNPSLSVRVSDGGLADINKIDDIEVRNIISNMLTDDRMNGIFFSISGYTFNTDETTYTRVSFDYPNFFVFQNDVLSITYSTKKLDYEIVYSGDDVEYVNFYQEIDENWYCKWRGTYKEYLEEIT